MRDEFPFGEPPFDRLTAPERRRLVDSLDLGVYARGAIILRHNEPADCLHVVMRGQVHERDGGETVAVFGPQGVFDFRALYGGGQPHSFAAAEDTLCHLVPAAMVAELARENPAFAEAVYEDFADRLRNLASERSSRELAALTMARVREAYLHQPVAVEGTASLRDAAVAMQRARATCVLVRDGGRTGILTDRDLSDVVVIGGRPASDPAGRHARYDPLTLDRDDPLFRALILMTRHGVNRIVVTEDGGIAGVLEQIDLLGVLSNHSQVIALQVDRAESPEELRKASRDVTALIRTLHATGVKIGFIAELVTELNRRVFRKLFELLAPPDLLANACLIVMGSEGRGEQLLKTDQDNGLILRDGFTCNGLDTATAAFTRHLVDFGYPPCPGNIMVSNPEWTRPLAAMKDALFHWIHRPDEAAQLNLAIFYDAAAVAGDPALLEAARGYLLAKIQDSQMFFTNFARAAVSFDTPSGFLGGLFDRRRSEPVDIKKAAVFPLVHGIRALALEKHLAERNTTERIWALADRGVLDPPFARELADAFAFLSTVRLRAHIDLAEAGGHTDNLVRPDRMTKLDRDQFHDCLGFVRRFKEFIAYHFHLGAH